MACLAFVVGAGSFGFGFRGKGSFSVFRFRFSAIKEKGVVFGFPVSVFRNQRQGLAFGFVKKRFRFQFSQSEAKASPSASKNLPFGSFGYQFAKLTKRRAGRCKQISVIGSPLAIGPGYSVRAAFIGGRATERPLHLACAARMRSRWSRGHGAGPGASWRQPACCTGNRQFLISVFQVGTPQQAASGLKFVAAKPWLMTTSQFETAENSGRVFSVSGLDDVLGGVSPARPTATCVSSGGDSFFKRVVISSRPISGKIVRHPDTALQRCRSADAGSLAGAVKRCADANHRFAEALAITKLSSRRGHLDQAG